MDINLYSSEKMQEKVEEINQYTLDQDGKSVLDNITDEIVEDIIDMMINNDILTVDALNDILHDEILASININESILIIRDCKRESYWIDWSEIYDTNDLLIAILKGIVYQAAKEKLDYIISLEFGNIYYEEIFGTFVFCENCDKVFSTATENYSDPDDIENEEGIIVCEECKNRLFA